MKQQKAKTKRKTATRYSESFKRQIIEEHLNTGIPKEHLQKKYGIKFKSAIFHWMGKLGYAATYRNNHTLGLINQYEVAKKPAHTQPLSTVSELENKIKILERQLEDERLRSAMYKRMIEIAEKDLKIPIRKNSNTK